MIYGRPSNETMHRWMRRDARESSGAIALDLGAGKMRNRPLFNGMRYIAIDRNPKPLGRGKKRYPEAEVIVGSISDLQLDTPADIAVSTLVFENKAFPAEQTLPTLKNVISNIAPGGSLLLNFGPKNLVYEQEIDALLNKTFESVRKRVYGRFHTVMPRPIVWVFSWLLERFPNLNEPAPERRRLYYCCRGRRATQL